MTRKKENIFVSPQLKKQLEAYIVANTTAKGGLKKSNIPKQLVDKGREVKETFQKTVQAMQTVWQSNKSAAQAKLLNKATGEDKKITLLHFITTTDKEEDITKLNHKDKTAYQLFIKPYIEKNVNKGIQQQHTIFHVEKNPNIYLITSSAHCKKIHTISRASQQRYRSIFGKCLAKLGMNGKVVCTEVTFQLPEGKPKITINITQEMQNCFSEIRRSANGLPNRSRMIQNLDKFDTLIKQQCNNVEDEETIFYLYSKVFNHLLSQLNIKELNKLLKNFSKEKILVHFFGYDRNSLISEGDNTISKKVLAELFANKILRYLDDISDIKEQREQHKEEPKPTTVAIDHTALVGVKKGGINSADLKGLTAVRL